MTDTVHREFEGDVFIRHDAPTAGDVACASCVECDGADHHWMPGADDDGCMVMVCKHCPVWKEMCGRCLGEGFIEGRDFADGSSSTSRPCPSCSNFVSTD